MSDDETIAAIRRFNRFHTRLVGALGGHVLASEHSLPQVRVLYELAHARRGAAPSARELAGALAVDAGYLSRLIAGLESQGLVERAPSPGNAKRLALTLSARGRQVFRRLDAASAAEVGRLIAPLSPRQRRELAGAMDLVRRLLGDDAGAAGAPFILREPEPGDLGWVVHRQARLYAEEHGWDATFEALVAGIVGDFGKHFDPGRERCWIAERDAQVVGSVFVVRHADEGTAQLRLLYVEPGARGHGLGARLVDECLRFARAKGYRRMVLWTNDVLASARRIYEAAGFRLTAQEPHRSFGKDLVGQTWARGL